MIPLRGTTAPEDIAAGDLVVLERRTIGKKTLARLADDLASRGAAGLIIPEEVLEELPMEERQAIEDMIPLLSAESAESSGRLLDKTARPARPETIIRAALRGRPIGDTLPLDTEAPIRALAILARADRRGHLSLAKLEEIISAEALLRDPRSQALTMDGMVVALTGEYEYGDQPDGLAEALLHRARAGLLLGNVTVGVGRAYTGVEGLRRTFRESAWAARAAELLRMGTGVVSFRQLGIYGMLEPFVSDPSTADTEDVERLIEYDKQNHTALLPTLEAYFEAGASGDAAASLFVHRNTVSYRLRAVKRVTGLDVRDPDARLLLEVQIRLARLRGLLPATSGRTGPRRSRRGRR